MKETTGKLGKIEEMFLSCPPGSERLDTALYQNQCFFSQQSENFRWNFTFIQKIGNT